MIRIMAALMSSPSSNFNIKRVQSPTMFNPAFCKMVRTVGGSIENNKNG